MNDRMMKLQEMLAKNPEDAFLHFAMGMEYLALQDPQSALGYLQTAGIKNPHDLAVIYQSALCLSQLDRTNEAIELLRKGEEMARDQSNTKTMSEMRSLREYLEEDE